ncbi:MAG: tRNA (adenosine(37)-N6)-dimethylallyltransferase MiaA [Dehalococcoidales bacterium]|nr:tRNA (adenosine(37)-N6)-dimethylallyltransferase MiaA [Dehalococcoidales bacterium]
MSRLVAIVGPTAIGKTTLAIHLAKAFNGEVVSADSRQIYRLMNIGTATPSSEELSLIPHHLINRVNPDEDFSLAQYQELAYQAISDINCRHRLPLLVGGSGQYVWSILEGWQIPQVAPDAEFRYHMEQRAATEGKGVLYQELVRVDPASARRTGPNNLRRIIRALEVYNSTRTPLSQRYSRVTPPSKMLIVGLTTSRAELYRRIDQRVDNMIEQGWVGEVQRLLDKGYSLNLPSMSSIGYRQIAMFLQEKLSLAEAIERTKFETHNLARHQYNWFRLLDKRIKWFDIGNSLDSETASLIAQFVTDK